MGMMGMGMAKTVLNTNKILLTISVLGLMIPASTLMGSGCFDY
jgi:hypothetical protein